MVLRVFSLPLGLRHALLTPRPPVKAFPLRRSSHWASDPRLLSFFTRSPVPRFSLTRALLWSVPIAGGLTLYLLPQPRNFLHDLVASPAIIPCSVDARKPLEPVINSPLEANRTFFGRIARIFRNTIWEPILTARRFIHLLALFLPVLLSVPMLLVGVPESKYDGDRWGAVWWYGFLVEQMERAGPTFIKLAQWAASRADLFPAILCDRMGKLHSRGNPHPLHHTKRVIESVFQRPFDEVFEEFHEEPIGCGAIAQVYKATLKHDLLPPSYLGPRRNRSQPLVTLGPSEPPPSAPTAAVALKILHPGAAALISRDLSIMSFFAHALSVLPGMQWLSLPDEVEVFGQMMYEQLDLRREAENLEQFERNFKNRPEPIAFPRPLKTWSAKDLLVEEYQNALPLEAFLRNGGGPFQDALAELGLDAFLNMLLLDNFVHADLHPGNIMIKFYKPASEPLGESIFRRLLILDRKKDPVEYVKGATMDSDTIIEKLRPIMHDPDAWRKELDRLSMQGYAPEIVFVDAGLVNQLNATNRRNFLDLFRAVAEFDGYRTGQLMVERCQTPELAIDTETFALKMQHLVLNVKRKTFSLGSIKISDILTEVLKAVREHHVRMEGDFINTVISILLLEGIGRQLDPGLDLFKSALPILRQLGKQMSAQEAMTELPGGNTGAFLKVWVLAETREMVNAAFSNTDDLIRYDWLTPNA
ncbi:ABC1-domain-containing protein [Gloeophyllum trabeum ATCC 11539]|uniref:ABC1-domain-containing protein n=1 Tax=Gloeophyllum trabeum (strain ATCC 11539 / FP-39264 / Madison 617) TaxID=670483 RepID=S7QLT1_GLOTA|nr:ABC1-domain-containing protein [Gloeophyllum trabeum ATCC 11539]EPQ60403.1 ABC1-domain-containing protein [Gloeophyllum trabeum ATCC 11539]